MGKAYKKKVLPYKGTKADWGENRRANSALWGADFESKEIYYQNCQPGSDIQLTLLMKQEKLRGRRASSRPRPKFADWPESIKLSGWTRRNSLRYIFISRVELLSNVTVK